ncbi:MAG: PAS domain S-box protein [Bryobacteraceae bacterium]
MSRESPKLNLGLALTFVALAAGISVAGYGYYRAQKESIESGIRDQLSAIADLKIQQISAWRQERIGDALAISGNPALGARTHRGDQSALRGWLENFRGFYGYQEIAVLERNGQVRLTASGSPFAVDSAVRSLCQEAIRTGQAAVSDLQGSEGGPAYLDLAAPAPGGDAVVVLRAEAGAFLYPAIQTWPVPSRTAESLLVGMRNGEVVYLNELRWKKGMALRLTLPQRSDLPAAMALHGVEGVCHGIDYRGVPVLAALRRVPETPWALVAKVDAAEVYEPLRARSLMMGFVVGVLLMGCAAVFGLLWRLLQVRFRQQRLLAELERKSLQGRYAHLSSQVNDIVLLFDDRGRIVEANDRAITSYGYSREELLRMSVRDLRSEAAREALSQDWRTLVSKGRVMCETEHRRKDGSAMPVELSARVVEFDGRWFAQSMIRDIGERKRAEKELRRVTRALRVLSACNQAVVRAADEDSLYREVCEAIATFGDYPMAWIGAPEHDVGNSVRVVSAAGPGRAYVDSIDISWADEPHGRGPVGTCLRTGEIAVCNDAGRDAAFEPWRGRAEDYGFRALISLPLWCDGVVTGALTIYASEPDAFHPEERSLLEELAGDVSYGVETRRRRREQERAEEALRQSENEFRTLFDNVSDAVFIVDTECRFLKANRVACERLGYSQDELVHMAIKDIDGTGQAAMTPEVFARQARPGYGLLETVHVRRDGSRFPVEVNARLGEYRGAPAVLSVVRDISERKRAEAEAEKRAAELERAREEAESANRAKSRFLAHMSHEIRTPLNGILGMIGLLLDTTLDSEQREFGETVRTSARALLALVNDLLDLSRIEAGRMELEPGRFDLAACLEETGELLAPQARAKGLDYVFDAEMACRLVLGDAGRIRQIVLNLLGNAIKFTERGRVRLWVRSAQSAGTRTVYRIAVEDTGPGIAEDKLPLLFRSFTQLDSSLARKHEGAGLGLAISRQLADLMGGALTVTSRLGSGSAFLLTLPLTALPDDGAEPTPAAPAERAPVPAGGRVRRVLLVEDNVVNQRLGVRTLEKLGCRADVAGNGREAVEMARKFAYDLILMDCRMPEMDGYTATQEIRKEGSAGARVPIVAMTAHAVSGAREECLGAGMDDYVSKPVSPADLERVLRRWSGG